MAKFNYTLSGTIEVPDDWKLNETGSGFELPDGRVFKLWEQAEVYQPETDDSDESWEDLDHGDCLNMGVHYDGDMCRFEENDE